MPSRVDEPTPTFKRVRPSFAVEVHGVDWSQIPLPENVVSELVAAADREGVLVFRNANLNNEEHIAFSRQIGELDNVEVHIRAGRTFRFQDQSDIFDVSNLDDKGDIVTDMDPGRKETSKGNFL